MLIKFDSRCFTLIVYKTYLYYHLVNQIHNTEQTENTEDTERGKTSGI